MGLIERVMGFLPSGEPKAAWGSDMVRLSLPDETLPAFINRLTATASAPVYRLPSVRQSMGVPAIQGAVSLIAGTTGMLTMQAYRNTALMDKAPSVVARPDPFQTPQQFYAMTASQMAKYGEFVWWIAKRDDDGLPSSLVPVPLNELNVQENHKNRLLPSYTWGSKTSTRYSPANTNGAFVHVKYPVGEPFALRGSGPLQLCNAATSVTVEAQAWAANFYADGGNPSVVIKHAGALSGELDDDGLSEADRLRTQWVSRAHNVPRVIDQNIESIDYKSPDAAGAQMLEARQYQNGDAARMFRIPGSLLEYQQPGASLTYQNLEGEFTKFVRTCLQPLYLEPIEQALSDLLPRSTSARFNVEGFLRADIRTRFDVHGIAIDKGIYGPEYARQVEGIDPGDVEFQPIPFSPPSAIPTTIPRQASRDVRCPKCNKMLARALGPGSEVDCPRCKTTVMSDGSPVQAAPVVMPNIEFNFPPEFVRVDSPVTVNPPDIHIEPTFNSPDPAPVTLTVDMPDTGARMDAIGSSVKDLAALVSDQSVRSTADQAAMRAEIADNTKANRAIAKELATGNKPRVFKVVRDPKTNQIASARSEVA